MAFFRIPITDAATLGAFYFTVDLDGTDYQLSFQYNGRENFWYMSILDTAGNQVRSGLKVIINFPLLARWVSERRPVGELLAIDTRSTPEDPSLETLGINNALIYGVS